MALAKFKFPEALWFQIDLKGQNLKCSCKVKRVSGWTSSTVRWLCKYFFYLFDRTAWAMIGNGTYKKGRLVGLEPWATALRAGPLYSTSWATEAPSIVSSQSVGSRLWETWISREVSLVSCFVPFKKNFHWMLPCCFAAKLLKCFVDYETHTKSYPSEAWSAIACFMSQCIHTHNTDAIIDEYFCCRTSEWVNHETVIWQRVMNLNC